MGMRPWDPQAVKLLADAHVEILRGGRRRPALRRLPRRN
jgi:hypothetical protein